MLTVVSGPFFPGLEQAFVERVLELKKDLFRPIAVVAPSSRLSDRLHLALSRTGVSFLNIHFHTFASLAQAVVDAEAPLEKSVLSDPLFFDTLVKQIVREDKPFEAFEQLAVPEGFPPAVRGTLRDLLDAGINEDNVQAAVQEDFAGKEVDLGSLRSLLSLHRFYLKRIAGLDVFPRTELLRQAIDLARESKYLKGFADGEILYYGFYDLTGLQADFFQAVTKNHPSRFYFPYVRERPAYAFAKRFRDTFVQPVMHDENVLEVEQKKSPALQILNVSGLRDEAWFVANEIRRLHDEQKIPFNEIAVVARTRERLGFLIQEALADRGIPYRAAAHPSLLSFPTAQRAMEMLLPLKPERELGAWSAFSKEAVMALEQGGAAGLLKDGAASLENFDAINDSVTWREFLDTLRDRWTRTEVRDEFSSDAGVALLYAEASRGLPFKAVFLVGLEEKIFPRVVREDPFLRDDARLALNQTLGHKIGQKMTALEEERLLFELIVTSASEHLWLIYQRSNDEGSVVGASPFLRAFADERGLSLEGDEHVRSLPRPLLEKIRQSDPASLGLSDVLVGFLAARDEAAALTIAKGVDRDAEGLARGLKLQRAIHDFGAAGPYDTLVGELPMEHAFRQGNVSATSLETYSVCGYKYFATRVLDVKPAEFGDTEESLEASTRGTFIHTFLEVFFRHATSEGKKGPPKTIPVELFNSLFEEVVPKVPPEEVLLPPLLWNATRALIRGVLTSFVQRELDLLNVTGTQPRYFEAEVDGRLDAPLDNYSWVGAVDRIDVKPDGIEIVDYKSGRPFTGKFVSKLAMKLEKLQAPLYLLLAQDFLKNMGHPSGNISFRYEFVEHPGESRILTPEEWAECSKQVSAGVRALLDRLLSGDFLLSPGRQCDYCEVARICRKNHGISKYRAEQARS